MFSEIQTQRLPLITGFDSTHFAQKFSSWIGSTPRAKRPEINDSLDYFLAGDTENLIKFLQSFLNTSPLCGMRHEMPNTVIKILTSPDKYESTQLTQGNCPVKYGNKACGHPELNGLAVALFVGESIVHKPAHLKGSSLMREIIDLDERIGALSGGGRDNQQAIKNEQQQIMERIDEYINALIDRIRIDRKI